MCSPNIYNDELDTNKCWRFNTYSSTKFIEEMIKSKIKKYGIQLLNFTVDIDPDEKSITIVNN
ncbi:hypothetical protein C6P40_001692 [Pichia californica]|uniref:Uncharacterized protein n=1 Tax=Pichia californica TaxID=460514 RepID=A0A9P6WP84_9ASCO|nr:hypothetical protein C6P42_002915 [[Candida] californica]KAG0690747.1 hypothetical protein C6P40_001692 [[Candida] californica]